MRIVVCDDNDTFAKGLIQAMRDIVLSDSHGDMDISYEYQPSPKCLLLDAAEKKIDILFLDIMMPEMDGMAVAKVFHDAHPDTCLIFISLREDQVYHAMRFSPFRYLRKGHLASELKEALLSAIDQFQKGQDCIQVTRHNACVPVLVTSIRYAQKEKQGNYIAISSTDGEYRYRGTIRELEGLLCKHYFVKINSGTLVHLKYISHIDRAQVFLDNKFVLYSAKNAERKIRQAFINYMREEH